MKVRFIVFVWMWMSVTAAFGQYTLTGHVENANGEPLIQASVFLMGTPYAAITDEKGNYTIEEVPDGEYLLKASYVGYKTSAEEIDLVGDMVIDINLGESLLSLEGVQINSTRVKEDAAFAYQNIEIEELEDDNLGQDAPFMLRWTPSAVVTSDAGAGIGYTGIRIRGTDQTRINVTVNGVPINDSESHNVFWVNMPDLMSSVDNIQIQRGVGTSTNGAAAFGGTISLNTNKLYQNPYLNANTSVGSFNSRRLSVKLGTGLLNDKYSIDGRYSVIRSDGYIDRASSDLNSWYFSAARLGEKSSLRFVAFSGNERTYQAWNGAPESRVSGNPVELQNYYNRNSFSFTPADSVNLFQSDRRYNFYTYENQVDDYQQDHYQLHYSLFPSKKFRIKTSVYYTRGLGFFEEFLANESYEIYSLPEEVDASGNPITQGDLVRRRWLDNDFYGTLINAVYTPNDNLNFEFGGAVSRYVGDHYGNVVSAEGISNINISRLYYEGLGDKTDANAYAKVNYRIGKLNIFGDIQWRGLDYEITGEDDDLTPLDIDINYSFFNPKLGLTYIFAENHNVYASFAVANKEPVRGDIIANIPNVPLHETLYDFEAGYRLENKQYSFEWNNYVMLYDNQLVLTGDVNNSGAFIRENVGQSYRIGMEFSFSTALTERLFWNINSTISSNRVLDYVEEFENFTIEHGDTDISFSPSLIAANTFMYRLDQGVEFELSTKFVGKQFLDNTSNEDRSLPAYSFSNLRIGYDWDPNFLGKVKLNAVIYNMFDARFSANGYTFSYAVGEEIITENFLYPQAGIHFMLGANVEF